MSRMILNNMIIFGDYIYLRTADPYLLLVEALAEQKKMAEATQKLIEFLAGRGIPASEINSAESDLIDYIRLQRRIELWGEGTSFINLKRSNDINRLYARLSDNYQIFIPIN